MPTEFGFPTVEGNTASGVPAVLSIACIGDVEVAVEYAGMRSELDCGAEFTATFGVTLTALGSLPLIGGNRMP